MRAFRPVTKGTSLAVLGRRLSPSNASLLGRALSFVTFLRFVAVE